MLTYTLIGLLAFIAGLVFGRYILPFPLWDRGVPSPAEIVGNQPT